MLDPWTHVSMHGYPHLPRQLHTERFRKYGEDMLAAEPYNTLCTMAAHGLVSVCGCEGTRRSPGLRLPGLTDTDQWDVDNDSPLLLRQMYLTSLAYKGMAGRTVPQQPGSFLEHPSDPKEKQPDSAHKRSTVWDTLVYRHWAKA